ncbi:MAG: hypothetical protein PWQ67_1536 [Clostridia bacterium]|jgi:hypothetical protein|nr:hypothetical protein [Clostridia bacterium]MDN5323082.1 hypothetical protein [Clostridia bacterium]
MITVLTGNFGSGKTEISINLAVKNQSTLIDLDIVNPYFRSRKAKEQMESKGVKVVLPPPYLANSDLPVIIPEVLGELQKENANIVIDVGGDNVGAIVLGRFSSILEEKNAEVLLVINPYRPFTQDYNGVDQMMKVIEQAARIKIKGIISNPNLGRATTVKDILEGHKKVETIAKDLNKTIRFLCCHQDLLQQIKEAISIPVLGIEIFMLTPWEL